VRKIRAGAWGLSISAVLAGGAAGIAASSCGGDDTIVVVPDAGGHDATGVGDAAMGDARGDVANETGGNDAGCAVFSPGPLDPNQVDAGLSLIKQMKCMHCHGTLLSGNNTGIQGVGGAMAYPPNLTPDPTTGLGCWTNAEVVNAILNGIDDQGMALCPPMPQFGHVDGGLDMQSAALVVDYLRSLSPIVNQVPDTECPATTGDAGGDGGGDAGVDSGSDAGADADLSDGGSDAADAADGE